MHAPVRRALEAQVEHGCTGRLRDLERDGHAIGAHVVAQPSEDEGLELDVERLLPDLAGTQPEGAEVERRHGVSVAPGDGQESISPAVRVLAYDHGS